MLSSTSRKKKRSENSGADGWRMCALTFARKWNIPRACSTSWNSQEPGREQRLAPSAGNCDA